MLLAMGKGIKGLFTKMNKVKIRPTNDMGLKDIYHKRNEFYRTHIYHQKRPGNIRNLLLLMGNHDDVDLVDDVVAAEDGSNNVGVVEMEEESLVEFNVPNELLHCIQSLLPAKDSARTCVLSKSWLHAWSTLPTLRFTKCVTHDNLTKQEQMDYIQLIDRTLVRYLNHNLSIDCFHLHLDINNSSLPFPLENWFQALAAASSSLKDLSLTICYMKLINHLDIEWLTLPDAIFSCENLHTLSLKSDSIRAIGLVRVNSNPPVIKCSLLRVLVLKDVCITEGTLDNLFSSCTLLEKIHIDFDFTVPGNKIKVENLPFLLELKLTSSSHNVLEIFHVPSLHLLSYRSLLSSYTIMKMNTLGSVRELVLSSVPIDYTFSELIKSKFPFLESLNLSINKCVLQTIDITCPSLKRFTLRMFLYKQINIQVYALELLYFSYDGINMPTLLFPSSTPAHINLILRFYKVQPIDLFYILKVREALDLSSNFDIETRNGFVPSNIDLDYLRRMVPLPARNVQKLSFGKNCQPKSWKHIPLLEMLFSICYPRYIKAYYRSPGSKNYWYNQMVRIMEKKMFGLKDIQIKSPLDGKWESLTISHFLFELPWRSFYDEGIDYNLDVENDYDSDEYKLRWLS